MAKTLIHISLDVHSIPKSLEFYQTLLGVEPTVVRPGYAMLEPREPALALALNEVPEATGAGRVSHFGIQVPDSDAVRRAVGRLMAAGLSTRREDGVTCCYAVQDKVWVQDPDGHAWEVYTVLDEAPVEGESASGGAEAPRCC